MTPRLRREAAVLSALALLAGCSGSGDGGSSPADVRYAFVVMGPGGEAVARAITSATTCPSISLDGKAVRMSVHAAAATVPPRPTAYDATNTVPAEFPVTTCDATIPPGTTRATLGSRTLPLPASEVNRIVVIGDTGCRMKVKSVTDGQMQGCDPVSWLFAQVSEVAASFAPDLVVHAGDYHYRETPCPSGTVCGGVTTYGFGWESWEVDFFEPVQPLLAAAPVILVRGDHETCDRGGQGWWRFLDPRPPVAGQDCNADADDLAGGYGDAYVVPLADDLVAMVVDTGSVSNGPYVASDPEAKAYGGQFRAAFQQASGFSHALFLNHQPTLAYQSDGSSEPGTPASGNVELQGVLGALNGDALFPSSVDAILNGHVHLAQVVTYQEGPALPPTFVAGNGGTKLIAPFDYEPGTTPPPYSKGTVGSFWQSASWGFTVLDRTGTGWTVTSRDQTGVVLYSCTVANGVTTCSEP